MREFPVALTHFGKKGGGNEQKCALKQSLLIRPGRLIHSVTQRAGERDLEWKVSWHLGSNRFRSLFYRNASWAAFWQVSEQKLTSKSSPGAPGFNGMFMLGGLAGF